VTGAGRGLGRAYALALARAGARVVVNDVGCAVDGAGADATVADAVVGEIRAAGGEAVASHAAIGTPGAAEAVVGRALDAFGRLDALVNNAGISASHPLAEFPDAVWERVLAVHLGGTFACARAAVRAMREGGGGRIVNTTSGAGLLTGYPGAAAYAAAKGGIAALTRVVAAEGAAAGITCNAVAPLARTRMSGAFLAGRSDGGAPEAVAPLVVYLASPASAGVSGHVFRVAAGRIGVVRTTAPEGVAAGDGTWTADEVARRIDEVLAGTPSGT
jgi:NAD(P)-dependent dehydrogenase (short-subunit alcohol dehydrogenase family)